ncbi:unnamed protein product [Darwinula stevensoni]|uniref:Uncharacterized protein n=1 Tax=Darwinula stevensoni TaxID=69355 RepID=A0A7R9FQC2_9CRUS|nr:unnamed protein product [Darwinula stevensoni]CAG0898906.1 unnamed protein product [Darwinula stevensoni]
MAMGIGKSPEGMEPLTGSLLVELSILAPVGQDAVAEDLKAFAEQLKPLTLGACNVLKAENSLPESLFSQI